MSKTSHEQLDEAMNYINEHLSGYRVRWECRNNHYAVELEQGRNEEECAYRWRLVTVITTGIERKDCLDCLQMILQGIHIAELGGE